MKSTLELVACFCFINLAFSDIDMDFLQKLFGFSSSFEIYVYFL